MRLSSQSLFLLLFVLVARVSLAAADLERKDQPLAATPTQAPTILNRYYARNDKSSDDGHEATIFDCSTKVIVRVPANGNKDDTSTMKQVKCRPTVVSIPASPTASVPTRSNKIETVTVTAKPKATSTKSSPHHQSSSSSGHKGDGEDKDKSGDKGSGSHNKEHSTDPSPSNGSDKDSQSSITTYSEAGDGNGGAAPTSGVNDPNDPTSGGSGNNNGNVNDPNSGNGDGSGNDGNNSGTTDGDNGDGSTTDGDNGNDDTTSDDGDDSTSGDGSDDDDSSENSGTTNEDNSNGGNGGTTQDPNTRSETQAVEGNVSNKSLGIGLGVGIGCVAAIGLAGLLVANKRKRENQSSTASYNDDVDTHWRPQSFMGVVASVVAKLPRSASLRSNHSKRDNAGMAVGAGQGAIEDPSATLGRHPSNSSTRSAASQPPSLARVQEHPREQMQEIDLRY
ncbi:hypothetical protein BDC45DRAFT_554307 [Circinella umbellata]|nr:hypothetical protein BDC45DRAFT_554307 [Circinella umbellata]